MYSIAITAIDFDKGEMRNTSWIYDSAEIPDKISLELGVPKSSMTMPLDTAVEVTEAAMLKGGVISDYE